MELADVTIPDAQVLLLARKLVAVGHAETADRLTVAYARGAEVVALTGDERDAILAVLDDPAPPLWEHVRRDDPRSAQDGPSTTRSRTNQGQAPTSCRTESRRRRTH